MDILDQIFSELGFSSEQKQKAKNEIDCLIKAETITQLIAGLSKEDQQKIKVDLESDSQEDAIETLKNFYTPEVIQEHTAQNFSEILVEYLDFMTKDLDDSKKESILKILKAEK